MSASGNPTSCFSNERSRTFREIIFAFLKLGLVSFGGPVAHIGYLREECVLKRRWLHDAVYGDLVALCQFLPGPTSSQIVIALGIHRAGWLGGLLASVCFTLPSAVLMIAFGYGVATLGPLEHAGWLHGLKLAAVAVVAQAVWGMGKSLCPDRSRLAICLAAAAWLVVFPGALQQLGVIISGGVVGWWLYHKRDEPVQLPPLKPVRHHLIAGGFIALFFILLILLPLFAAAYPSSTVAVLDSFYRAGALVFGGGHVILPLLRAELVPSGWVADDTFLAGYGAAQALPGPLFTLAGYLGVVMQSEGQAWLRGIGCLLAIFLPGCLLVSGALPFWHRLRAQAWTQAASHGANAAVVGILLAALYYPVWTEGVKQSHDAAAAVLAFALLQWWRVPPWLVVLLSAAAGQWLLPGGSHLYF